MSPESNLKDYIFVQTSKKPPYMVRLKAFVDFGIHFGAFTKGPIFSDFLPERGGKKRILNTYLRGGKKETRSIEKKLRKLENLPEGALIMDIQMNLAHPGSETTRSYLFQEYGLQNLEELV